jgi:hypothetical protein
MYDGIKEGQTTQWDKRQNEQQDKQHSNKHYIEN